MYIMFVQVANSQTFWFHFKFDFFEKYDSPVSEKEKRATELVVYHTDDITLCDRSQHMCIKSPPTGLQLEREIKVGQLCTTVCHYKGYTYVGLDNGAVDRIDEKGTVNLAFIQLPSSLASIRAQNDQLFIQMYHNTS